MTDATESAEGSRISTADGGVVALDAGGGAGHPDRVSSNQMAHGDHVAVAGLSPPSAPQTRPAGDGAFAVPPDPAGAFSGRRSSTGIPLAQRMAIAERRAALITELWPQAIHRDEVRRRINALGGPQLSTEGIRRLAQRAGVKRGNENRVVQTITGIRRANQKRRVSNLPLAVGIANTTDAPGSVEAKLLKAAEMIRAKRDDVQIMRRTGLALRQIRQVYGRLRMGLPVA